ncbi:hypothetical protein SLS58_009733 [Diplodia intermedia]|uniref:Uncharacterized protein n=1 Tax=Diplodia intermedia TaxID=856260 RepID=A0ABR3TAM0_9PEZI
MVKEQPNRDLVASLGVDSAFLQLQQENFRKARLTMKQTSVVAFFETQETPTVQNSKYTAAIWKVGDDRSIKTPRYENVGYLDE